MQYIKQKAAALVAALFMSGICGSALAAPAPPKLVVLKTEGRRVTAQAVNDAYGTRLTRGGIPAAGAAQTGDLFPDGRELIVHGDLAPNGQVDIADLVVGARAVRGDRLASVSEAAGDINGSGRIDIADLAHIAAMLPAAKPVPLAELPPFPLDCFKSQVSDMIAEVNRYRATKGLPPLTERGDMNWFCQVRAEEQLQHPTWDLSHLRPDGSDFWEGAQCQPSGEILAHCWFDPDTGRYMDAAHCAVEQWIDSPGHERVMVNPTAAYAGGGIAYGKGPNGMWWWKAVVHIGHAQD